MSRTVYKSEITWWVWLPVLAAIGAANVAALVAVFDTMSPSVWVDVVMVALLDWMIIDMLLNTRYVIEGHFLKVRCSLFGGRYDLNKLTGVVPTHTWLSAPALSLDRLMLTFGRQSVVISPSDRDSFLDQILPFLPR